MVAMKYFVQNTYFIFCITVGAVARVVQTGRAAEQIWVEFHVNCSLTKKDLRLC